jgi:hypothetical protein
MHYSIKHVLKLVSCILVASFIVGFIPWQELSADAKTHGEYKAYPLEITYEQNSSWGYSTQGQYTVKNVSEYTVNSWTIEIKYQGDVRLSNIWNAKDITNYDTDENIIVSSNTKISAGQTYTFGLIADGQDNAPVAPQEIDLVQFDSDEPANTPTPTPTEEIKATDTPVATDPVEPANTTAVASTPVPEETAEIFPYAIFSSSKSTNLTFQGWKSNIVGDVYTGKNFSYQGSELYVDGTSRAVGNVQSSGWKTEMHRSGKCPAKR